MARAKYNWRVIYVTYVNHAPTQIGRHEGVEVGSADGPDNFECPEHGSPCGLFGCERLGKI